MACKSVRHENICLPRWQSINIMPGFMKGSRRSDTFETKSASTDHTQMEYCNVCLDLDRRTDENHRRWKTRYRDDSAVEYLLRFDSKELQSSANSGCSVCSTVLSGLEIMDSKGPLSLGSTDLHGTRRRRGSLILRQDCPLEVELFNVERRDSPPARLQYYKTEGKHSD
jgi:hypothetical protein